MPVKGENPITSYFPRATQNSKLKSPLPNLTKRPRQADESDTRRDKSRKRLKGRKTWNGADFEAQLSPSVSSHTNPPRHDNLTGRGSRTVIEIQDTPPSSPSKQASLRCTTPPSSPLPELTPTPEPLPLKRRSSSIHSHMEATSSDLVASPHTTPVEAQHAAYCDTESELVLSSQTQALDVFCDGEGEQTSHTLRIFTGNPIFKKPHNPYHARTAPDDFVASSQSQLIEPKPASPTDPGAELVPSSQTQEIYRPQVSSPLSQRATPVKTNKRWTPLRYSPSQDQESSKLSQSGAPRSQSSQPGESLGNALSTTLDSEISPSMSRPSNPSPWDVNYHSQSQESERLWNDDLSSYGSLPDAVKEFQEMFNGTYESHPPA